MHFNSHAHVERDSLEDKSIQQIHISTHTLTWSVTIDLITKMGFLENFNSHAHVERDAKELLDYAKDCNFNSHAHVERDNIDILHSSNKLISTHTLTWSVTIFGLIPIALYIFQLTRSRGA